MKNKPELNISDFIDIADSQKLYYHGNSYKEVLNYTYRDNLSSLLRNVVEMKEAETPETKAILKKRCIYNINEILNAGVILELEQIQELPKKYSKIIF